MGPGNAAIPSPSRGTVKARGEIQAMVKLLACVLRFFLWWLAGGALFLGMRAAGGEASGNFPAMSMGGCWVVDGKLMLGSA